MVSALAMISLSGLHSWVGSIRCGMVRLGRTSLLSLDNGVFLCDEEICRYVFVSHVLR